MFNEKDLTGVRLNSNTAIHAVLKARKDARLEEGSWLNSLLSDDCKAVSVPCNRDCPDISL